MLITIRVGCQQIVNSMLFVIYLFIWTCLCSQNIIHLLRRVSLRTVTFALVIFIPTCDSICQSFLLIDPLYLLLLSLLIFSILFELFCQASSTFFMPICMLFFLLILFNFFTGPTLILFPLPSHPTISV